MRTVIHTHEPPLARRAELLGHVWHDLRRSPQLALEMAKRDIRGQWRTSFMGPLVVVLPPLMITAVAIGFRRNGILQVDSSSIPYPLFVLVGVVLWMTLLDAVNAPVYGFLAELRLLARTSAPPEAIALGKLGTVFFNALVRAVLLTGVILAYRIPVPATVLLAPLGLLSLIVVGLAIGLFVAPLNAIYHDVSWMLTTLTTFWFFFSPVYFPVPSTGPIGVIMRFNPITPILSDTRSLILTGSFTHATCTALVTMGGCLLLAAGWLYARIVFSVVVEQVND